MKRGGDSGGGTIYKEKWRGKTKSTRLNQRIKTVDRHSKLFPCKEILPLRELEPDFNSQLTKDTMKFRHVAIM